MKEGYYSKFKRVYETSNSIKANEYLELGWVLLNVVKTQVAEESWTTYYILGWNKESEEPQQGRTYSQRMDAYFEAEYGEKREDVLSNINEDELF